MLVKGKSALVTGGARGIGKEIVETLLKNGANVYFIDLNPSEYMADYEVLAKEAGVKVVFKQANVASEEDITNVVEEIIKEAGELDILVNNAGITRDGLLFRMSGKDWHDVININLSSAFYITRIVARHMAKLRRGSIVNMSSIVGAHGNAGQVNYSASKAGLIGLTKSVAQEIASRGVRCNAIAPGFIKTAMTDKLTDDQKDGLLKQVPMGRLGLPSEIADLLLFLTSDMSQYITGQVIEINGGMAM
ncbi:3-oxoacyl-[acyl-carrier-protein] reductase [Spirochaeta cellobiosiphila]|uniref:3-oxoacyl-[acyl-carrier-protein] reductase n=1 Tax=Spirochaeta cellobiosiphila TaxID=504483 RepID=UPI0003F54555|nr:3-oxoacyl-[acyl-carrier-protein] reductase [Spirochaeta cellobiosiphila]